MVIAEVDDRNSAGQKEKSEKSKEEKKEVLEDKKSEKIVKEEKSEKDTVEVLKETKIEEVEEVEKEDLQAEKVEKEVGPEESEHPSFYEKVLGEKPPENIKNNDENEELVEEKEGINKSLFFLGGVVFVLTILIAGGIGFILLNSNDNQKRDEQAVAVTPSPSETPTPSLSEIDRENFTFEVLNGSGEGGKAGRTADAIESLGYSIGSIGNADTSDYSGIQAGFSEDVSENDKKIILSELKKEFLEAEENEDLKPDDTDILVIVGK